ncbi:MAG TPA: Gldg family protein [Verrucomicrobiae bacterium]|nr:Gldg family protein [Verrucomicrobiae bacterium]
MKQKNIETILYSAAGVAVMFVLLLAFYVVTSAFKDRIDLTQEKAFTLSPGTKKILSKLDSSVTIRFYCTQSGTAMPPALRTYAEHIEDLLGEYKQAGRGKIKVEKFDPQPDSDAEDSAHLDGVEGQATTRFGGDKVYLGIAVTMLDQKVALPWLPPNQERSLEYDISRAIARVVNPTPAVIGLMSALPVFGSEPNPMMQRMGQSASEPWTFVSELKKDFTIREIPMTADKIDDDIGVLLVVHPRDITETTQYAIDQFVLRGGKLLAFLDPHAYFDQKHDQMAQVLGESSGQSSLPILLKAWGLDMDVNKVVADMTFAGRNPQNNSPMPTVLLVTKTGLDDDDIVTSQIDNLVLPFAGAFTGKPADGLKETVLVHASPQSELVEGVTASIGGDQIVKDFKPSGVDYAMAVRLTGKFKTAFPDGPPKPAKDDKEDKAEPKDQSKATQLKESTGNGVVLLVADADLLADQVCVQVQNFLGYHMVQRINGNLNLMQSFVEQLAGDSDLIGLRSRASLNRPFTRLKEMEAKAGREYEDKVKELEARRDETERKISELQAAKAGNDQKFILSPEQQKELENYQKTVADANKDLRLTQKKLRKETDALEFWTKVTNIGTMPILVAGTGIVLAIYKRKRTAAQ